MLPYLMNIEFIFQYVFNYVLKGKYYTFQLILLQDGIIKYEQLYAFKHDMRLRSNFISV